MGSGGGWGVELLHKADDVIPGPAVSVGFKGVVVMEVEEMVEVEVG